MERMKWEMLKLGKGNNAKLYENEKQQKRATGIAVKLILEIVVLIIMVSASLTMVSYNKSSSIITSNILNNLQNRARENASTIDEKIGQWTSEMQTLARREGIAGMDWEVQQQIAVSEAKLLGYEEIQVTDSKGMTHVPGIREALDSTKEENIQLSLKGKTCITNPYYDEKNHKLVMLVTTPIFSLSGNRLAGVLGGKVDAEQFNQIVQAIELGENGYAFILDSQGTRIADKDIDVVKEGRVDIAEYEGDISYKQYVDTQKAMIAGEQGISEYAYEGVEYYAAYYPLEYEGWSVALAMPKEEVMKDVNSLRNYMTILTGLFLLVGVIISILIARTIKRPLRKINRFAEELSNGNMCYEIHVTRKDEFGRSCAALNVAKQNIRKLVRDIADNAQGLSSAGEELTATTDEISSRLEMIREASDQVVKGCENNKELVQSAKVYVENMQQSVEALNVKAHAQSEKAGEFKERAIGVQTTAKAAIKNSREVCEKHRSELMEAIEAARAGESGKGFAVVVTEVGNLATQTKETVDIIQATIQKVRDAFSALSDNGKELLSFVDEEVQPQFDAYLNTGENYYYDADYVYQLSREQADMVSNLVCSIGQVEKAVKEVEETSAISLESTVHIQEQINHTTTGMEEVVKATENIAGAAEELNKSTNQFAV